MNTPTPTPEIYCPDMDTIIVTSSDDANSNITGTYTIEHKSSIGVKYVNHDKTVKITYSTKINNIVNGHWRWALNTTPYTLFYANPSTQSCMPRYGWVSVSGNTFTGSFSGDGFIDEFDVYQPCQVYDVYKNCGQYDVYQPCLVYDQYKKCSPYDVYKVCEVYDTYKRCDVQITPTPTPSSTPHPTLTITPEPTPVPTPYPVVIPVERYAPPAGIIRNELTEHVWIKAKPTVSYSDPVRIHSQHTPKKITVHGLSMNYTEQVFLSGSTGMLDDTMQVDMFSHIPSLSADYPGFTGQSINYIVKNENVLDVYIPSLVASGMLDIIIVNRAGYGSLSPTYATTQWTDYNLQNRLIYVE